MYQQGWTLQILQTLFNISYNKETNFRVWIIQIDKRNRIHVAISFRKVFEKWILFDVKNYYFFVIAVHRTLTW